MPKKKKKVYVEKYYSLSEDEIQEIVARAKEGSEKDQLQLLEIFSNFLSKYVALLYYSKYSLGDYDIRRFIALFVKDPNTRFFLLRNKLNSAGVKHVNEVIRGIQYMTQRYGSEEDVDQTVKMAFLSCVSVYKRKGKIPFSAFLYSYFFFVLKKLVDSLLIDQLGRKTFPLIDNEEFNDTQDGEEQVQGFAPEPEPGVEELLWAEQVDEHWVAGDTASSPFDKLSIQDRQLLRWRYVEKERSGDIAQRITEHPNTIREHFNRIRKQIRETLDEELALDI